MLLFQKNPKPSRFKVYVTHLSHHRYEGFESEVQGQNFSRFTETETLETPKLFRRDVMCHNIIIHKL